MDIDRPGACFQSFRITWVLLGFVFGSVAFIGFAEVCTEDSQGLGGFEKVVWASLADSAAMEFSKQSWHMKHA